MSLPTTLAIIFAVLASICIVTGIILLGWFLIWKTFLSKFRLVQELLGHTDSKGTTVTTGSGNISTSAQSHLRTKKLRKD